MNTDEIIRKLEQLNIFSSELDIPELQRREMVNQVVDYTNTFINGLNKTKGYEKKEIGNLAIQKNKSSLTGLLNKYQKEVAESGINAASPKHLGYIPGGGVFTAALADFIAAVTNPFASAYFASPGAATIENEVINWLKSVFSFPPNSVGNLSSGGSISTLIAFTAARDKYKIKNELIPKTVVYLSKQAHHSAQKLYELSGWKM
ncbi:MAG: pyridoxal-dependent decarboxylase [Ferruginibacter sp.]